MLFGEFNKFSGKLFPVHVKTMDAELEFDLDLKSTGSDLLNLVSHTIGLRQTWYFGLQYVNSEGFLAWLKLDKKVCSQHIPLKKPMSFLFLVKFYPEDIADELIQETAQHLFFLQVKQAVLNMNIYCPPDASVLLASYAIQANYGDYDEATYKLGMFTNEDLLPQHVIEQYQMTPEMWEEKIKCWYSDHHGMTRNEAKVEYLKTAQDLDMYGVNYFPIVNIKKSQQWLGVTALGINIYDRNNKLSSQNTFLWREIKNASFDNKKFTVKLVNKSSPLFQFYSSRICLNKLILDLCIGNHGLFMNRRKPDSMEIQQMKAQAREIKIHRQIELNKKAQEKQLRAKIEREKAELERRMIHYQEEAKAALKALGKYEKTAELLAEKARIAEKEAMLLTEKASAVEAEIQQFKIRKLKKPKNEKKKKMERNACKAELFITRMVQESECLKELLQAQMVENDAKKNSKEIFKNNYFTLNSSNFPTDVLHIVPKQYFKLDYHETGISDLVMWDILADQEMKQLTLEIEKERMEYLEKSKHFQEQLFELKNEIEILKIDEYIVS